MKGEHKMSKQDTLAIQRTLRDLDRAEAARWATIIEFSSERSEILRTNARLEADLKRRDRQRRRWKRRCGEREVRLMQMGNLVATKEHEISVTKGRLGGVTDALRVEIRRRSEAETETRESRVARAIAVHSAREG
jgi:hypothetical protein